MMMMMVIMREFSWSSVLVVESSSVRVLSFNIIIIDLVGRLRRSAWVIIIIIYVWLWWVSSQTPSDVSWMGTGTKGLSIGKRDTIIWRVDRKARWFVCSLVVLVGWRRNIYWQTTREAVVCVLSPPPHSLPLPLFVLPSTSYFSCHSFILPWLSILHYLSLSILLFISSFFFL